jgi:hypothetical protein
MTLEQGQGKRQRGLAISQAVVLGALAAIFLISSGARGSDQKGSDQKGILTEEFHNTYPLAAQGRIQIENINGPVHISAWDRNEVKVDAVKSARSQERLDQAKIDIRAGSEQSLDPHGLSRPRPHVQFRQRRRARQSGQCGIHDHCAPAGPA